MRESVSTPAGARVSPAPGVTAARAARASRVGGEGRWRLAAGRRVSCRAWRPPLLQGTLVCDLLRPAPRGPAARFPAGAELGDIAGWASTQTTGAFPFGGRAAGPAPGEAWGRGLSQPPKPSPAFPRSAP